MSCVLITGNNPGLCLEFVRQTLARGERVIAGFNNLKELSELHQLSEQYSDQLILLRLDVTQKQDIEFAFDRIASFAENLDILINNAGIQLDLDFLPQQNTYDLLRISLVNAAIPIVLAQKCLPMLKSKKHPAKIINILSMIRLLGTQILKIALMAAFAFLPTAFAQASIHKETIDYKDREVILEGYLAYDDSIKGKRPGVLVVHEWTGISDYEKRRVEELARAGYIAFAADIYGKGIRPETREEAARQAGIYRGDRKLMRKRVQAGLAELKKHPLTDSLRVAAIGYCFGGGVVLELARSGADIKGVVSFHGNLDTPNPEDAKMIKAKVLVLRGTDDPYVSTKQVKNFEEEMRKANVDWRMVSYEGAVHGFTNPASGNDPSRGVAYNKEADMKSWREMIAFFKEIFHDS